MTSMRETSSIETWPTACSVEGVAARTVVPITPTCKGRDHSDVMRTWFWHARRAHPGIFRGKTISMVSPAVEGYAPCGIPFGSTSGQMYKTAPGILRRMYSIPYEVFEIEDYAAKYYAIMRTGLGDGFGMSQCRRDVDRIVGQILFVEANHRQVNGCTDGSEARRRGRRQR